MPDSSSISIGDYGRGIYLKRYTQTRTNANNIDGFRFKVEAYGGNNIPNKIFRYAKEDLNAREATYRLAFDGVCSPSDIEEYPEDEPNPEGFPQFCRLDYVDLVFRSQSVAEDAWQILVEEVTNLVSTLNIMDVMEPSDNLKIGDPPPADSSSSIG